MGAPAIGVFRSQESTKHGENNEKTPALWVVDFMLAGKWTRIESMYFLLKMGMSFQPAMLVYQR